MSRRKEPAIPAELLDQHLAGGDAAAALDQGGLLDTLKKALAERALNPEMDHHLGGDEQAGTSRNGYGRKSVVTDTGKIEIDVPRDRQGSFDPQLIGKYQCRFPGFDDKIISMYARGMSSERSLGICASCTASTSRRSHIDGHRRGARGSRRLAGPAARSGLSARVLRCNPGEDPR